MNKFIKSILLSATFILILAGCSSKNTEEQEAYRQYGIRCMHNGSYEDAVNAFQKALDCANGKFGKTETDICLYKGKAHFLAGNIEDALECYQALIDYNEDSAAYYERGCLYFATDQPELALTDFKKAVEVDDRNFELYVGISETFARYGDKDKADEYLDKALRIEPKTDEETMEKGRVFTLKEDYNSAQECFQKAIDAGLVQANFYMGKMFYKKGDTEKAEEFFQEYMNSEKITSEALWEIAQTEMEEENYEIALKILLRADEMETPVTDVAGLKKSIVVCYEKLEDFENAKLCMKEYMKQFPNDQDAIKEWTFLETR